MALNNMTNTPEAVEEHIRKQIQGSGIGQVMAQAILAAQKPMNLTQLAQKHNLEPESAKELYAATYSDCIYESGFVTLSLHRTIEGAEKAIKAHRRKLVRENRKNYLDMKKLYPEDDWEQAKIRDWQKWRITILTVKD